MSSTPQLGRVLSSLERLAAVVPAAAARAASLAWGDPDHGLRELANKARAYQRFRDAAAGPAGPPATGPDDWEAVWVKEGIGFRRAAAADPEEAAFPGIGSAPAEWLLPLHTGGGLLLATRCLDGVAWRAPDEEILAALAAFVRRCGGACLPGWRLAAVEALGLATRMVYPHRVDELDRLLGAVGADVRRAFWHGLGRGAYFTPLGAVPFLAGSAGDRLAAVVRATSGDARDQAVAGWAWALTLVNLRNPEVVASVVSAPPADLPAFADGVASALVVWHACGGGDARLAALLDHRPTDPCAAPRWERLTALWRRALERRPEPGRGLGGLFAYRPERWAEPAPWDEERSAPA